MMKKKTTFGFALTCVLIAAALAFTGGFLIARNKVNAVTKPTQTSGSGYEIVDEVEKVIKDEKKDANKEEGKAAPVSAAEEPKAEEKK